MAVGAGGTGGVPGQIPSPLPSPPMFQPTPAPLPVPIAGMEAVSGPGPLRHPRPLTAAELHQQLEREQEAVVNRLTRELALLRAAQNASVVSNASSTSASATGAENPNHSTSDTHLLSGAGYTFPTPRHHRTSSNTSALSQGGAALLSTASHRSRTSSPGPSASAHGVGADSSLHYLQQQRVPHASVSGSSVVATPGSVGGGAAGGGASFGEPYSPGLLPATARYEETAFYRSELEVAKKENDALRRRVRELERMGGRPTERDRGVSITGSVGVGVPEDEVKVGESAASAGLHRMRSLEKEKTGESSLNDIELLNSELLIYRRS
ncbi:unnamed protein product [Parascedosporium putredinis]|uniref:Uncharacterized protein n=1 Tax=Parascedosporium putredinis TaxID=1442378 RepID=A0A9P1GYU4_9PEZI|nr:unnamed protein product [Parascedosporium putredinis]CAI7992175.1 unnamed protein product [Parascedosporium putredinis]